MWSVKLWLGLIFMLLLLIPRISTAQLSELEVSKISPETSIPVFSNYPGMAAVEIRSSLTNLSFTSTWDIIDELGNPEEGRYILIVEPVRQSLIVSATGYMQARIPLQITEARSVEYFSVEPKNRTVTERGTLIVQTNPQGATIELDGVPGEFTSNYTFDDILAQSYILRVILEDYETEERVVTVSSQRPVVERIDLLPSYGFLEVDTDDVRIFIQDEEADREYRVSINQNEPLKLDIGRYKYRAERTHFLDQTGEFEISRDSITNLNLNLNPNYGTLIVNSNVSQIKLSAVDNEAPTSPVNNEIYLESGRRIVTVEANGYVTQELEVNISPGQIIGKTVRLETFLEQSERRRREALPSGILEISADVDAEIYVDGKKQGVGEVVLTLSPGPYEVEFLHPVNNKRRVVYVPSAGVYSEQVYLKPTRKGAITRSLLLPGLGHTYTNRSRGYLYLAAFAGAGTFAYLNYNQQQSHQSELDELTARYNSSNSVREVANLRDEIERLYPEVNNAHELKMAGMYATAGLYLLQLADLLITKPEYGYRRNTDSRINLSTGANRIKFTIAFN